MQKRIGTYEEAKQDYANAITAENAALAECNRIEAQLKASVQRLADLRSLRMDARIILNKCARLEGKEPTI